MWLTLKSVRTGLGLPNLPDRLVIDDLDGLIPEASRSGMKGYVILSFPSYPVFIEVCHERGPRFGSRNEMWNHPLGYKRSKPSE